MSIENLFNSPEKQKRIKALADEFNPIVQGLRDLAIGDDEGTMKTNDIIKHLVGVYTKRREDIGNMIDEEADITVVKKTRAKRTKTEGAPADEPAKETSVPAPATPAKKTGKKVGEDMM